MGDLFLLSGRNPAQTSPSLSLSTAQLRSMISGEMHSDSVPHTYSEAPLSGCPPSRALGLMQREPPMRLINDTGGQLSLRRAVDHLTVF